MQQTARRNLHRSTTNKMLTGVCGGLGEFLGVDATIIRLVVLVLAIPFSLVIGLLYLMLALILPAE
jgi:phage shock protein C